MGFNIGDKVRLKHDSKDDLPLIVRAVNESNLFLCLSGCGIRRLWCCDLQLELIETQTDIKQAIREVLLSEEFLKAFSRAYMETPCIPAYEINLPPTIVDASAINQNGESK